MDFISPASCAGAFRPQVAEEVSVVLQNEIVNGEYRHLVVRTSALAAQAQAGQFFQLLCPAPPGEAPFFRRPMSVYGADITANTVSFLYKVAGVGTRGLATLRPGDALPLLGPLGQGFVLDPAWRHVVAIGRGAGLATLGPLAVAAKAAGIGMTAILSARRSDLVMSEELFRSNGVEVLTVTDSDGSSDPAKLRRLLCMMIADGRCDALFTCGSSRILRLLQDLAREFDIPGQVALEQQMACGLGMCFCCVRDFNVGGETVHQRVCWDGPVFDLLEAVA